MEIKTEITPLPKQWKTYSVKMMCDVCVDGEMLRINPMWIALSNPPQYEHQCNSCGKRQHFFEVYPTTRVEVEV